MAGKNWLDVAMEEQGRMNMWLARQLHVSEATISRWRNGVTEIPGEHVPAICDALGLEQAAAGRARE